MPFSWRFQYIVHRGAGSERYVACVNVCIVQTQVNGDMEILGRYDCTSHAG